MHGTTLPLCKTNKRKKILINFTYIHDAASLNILMFFPDGNIQFVIRETSQNVLFSSKIELYSEAPKCMQFAVSFWTVIFEKYYFPKLGCITLRVFCICLSSEGTPTVHLGGVIFPLCAQVPHPGLNEGLRLQDKSTP